MGSSIRTLTYNPTAPVGAAPPEGDIFIFAKVIDAGEAGISGRNVTLGATTVLNVQNISFSGSSVAFPAPDAVREPGGLTGTSSLSDKRSLSTDSTNLAQQAVIPARARRPSTRC